LEYSKSCLIIIISPYKLLRTFSLRSFAKLSIIERSALKCYTNCTFLVALAIMLTIDRHIEETVRAALHSIIIINLRYRHRGSTYRWIH